MELTGRIVSAPTMKYSRKGMPYCLLTVIYEHDKAKHPVFFDMVCFRDVAEAVYAQYIKGDIIKIARAFPMAEQDASGKANKSQRVKWSIAELGSADTKYPALPIHLRDPMPEAELEELIIDDEY